MGLNNSFMNLARIAGPLWAGMVRDINFRYPFITGSVTMLFGFVAVLIFLRRKPETNLP
ncbi:MAG: hypothetical protein HN335_13055 [Anaerolineae bacterium]|nr:hypothetical protein [Anaerolineae bacterium]